MGILVAVLFLVPFAATGADTSAFRIDSSRVEVREPPAGKLDAYRSDPAYDYGTEVGTRSVGSWLGNWLAGLLPKQLQSPRTIGMIFWAVVGLALLVLVWALLRLLGIGSGAILRGKATVLPILRMADVEVGEEADFRALTQAAVDRADYRSAVRFCYLHALQVLAGAGLIAWKSGKTNHIYERELRASSTPETVAAFAVLTRQFEYAWYGDLPVPAPAYERVRSSLEAVLSHVRPEAARRPASDATVASA